MVIESLLLDGGGCPGISYIGVIKALEKMNMLKNIKTISGSSIGSIFGLLIVLGYVSSEIQDIIFECDIEKIFSLSYLNFIKNGVYGDDKYIVKILKSGIKMKYNKNITFLELFNKTNIKFIVNTTCLCDNQPFYFDHTNSPDMPVWLAVRMSISIPYVFPAVYYKEKYYVDGGVFALPIHLFDMEKTLVFTLFGQKVIPTEKFYILKQLINTIGKFQYSQHKNIIVLKMDTKCISSPKKDKMLEMIKTGFCTTIQNVQKNIK